MMEWESEVSKLKTSRRLENLNELVEDGVMAMRMCSQPSYRACN